MNNDFNDIFNVDDLKKNPFKVPEGYFESFESSIMSKIQSAEKAEEKPAKKARILSMRPFRWAAACACVLVVSASAFLYFNHSNEKVAATPEEVTADISTSATMTDDAFNQAADYTCLDTHDMYMMLAEE